MRGSTHPRPSALPGASAAPRAAARPPIPAVMDAVICRQGQVTLEATAVPIVGPDDALIRVAIAGVCRTDSQVAAGRLPAASPVILGHEIAGHVVALGARALGAVAARIGDPVAVDPRQPCRGCPACAAQRPCQQPRFLGVDVDGGFAEYLRVAASTLIVAPAAIDDLRALAYTEPVAATLAILGADIHASERGVIVGSGRIAALAARILALHGFESITLHDPAVDPPLAEGAYDFAIETDLGEAAIAAIIRALRPRGRIVLKSRQVEPMRLHVRDLLAKELRLSAAYYGDFTAAAAIVAREAAAFTDLWAPLRPLADVHAVLAEAAAGEHRKLFFAVGDPEDRACAGSSAPSP